MIEIVPFDKTHISAAADAEKRCFSAPWSEESLKMLTLGEPFLGLVALVDGELAAYGGMMCIDGEAQMLNIVTLPEHRRRGFARDILSGLYAEARSRGALKITLEVRESNAAAQSLYKKEGFFEIGKRPNYYQSPREAAIIMEKQL